MAAANGSTFDLATARRPSADDTGASLVLVDDTEDAPDPNTMPSAAPWNTMTALAAAFGGIVPHTVVSVHIAAGAPAILLVASVRAGVVAGTFTVSDVAAGNTSVTWAAGTFPPAVALPMVSINTDGSWLSPTIVPITNGIQVKTRNSAGTLTDGDWTAAIY